MVTLRMSRVLVSGASRPIGTALLPSLESSGGHIVRLKRRQARNATNDHEHIPWDPGQLISPDAVSGFDAVIHLAGESIVGRWTPPKKARIRDRRVTATRNLAQALRRA